jgi:hypothetical protein
MANPIDPRIAQARPGWALFVLAAPVGAVIVVILLYMGMAWLGMSGRAAQGERTLRVESCPEGMEVIQARLADVGLPATVRADGSGWVLQTAYVGREDVDEALPDALAKPGVLVVRGTAGTIFGNDAVTEATYRLDGMMDMWLLLRLNDQATQAVVDTVRSDPQGRMTLVLDGEDVALQPNRRAVQRGEVEAVPLADMDQVTRMRLLAEWSMQIDHPLPCAATVVPL